MPKARKWPYFGSALGASDLDWLDDPLTRGHRRTHDGDEIDLVLERGDGLVTAVEVKAGSRVRPEDLAAVSRLRNKLGRSFLGG